MMAANLYYYQIQDLMFELSMCRCNEELRVRADELHRLSKRDAKHFIEFWKTIPSRAPYRVILGDVKDKLYQTRERSLHLLDHSPSFSPMVLSSSIYGIWLSSLRSTLWIGQNGMYFG